jgi:hypothetical protein
MAKEDDENKTTTRVKKELNKTPIYVPYVNTYNKRKTKKGIVETSSALLKRYYSSIDAEIYFGNEYVEDICDISYAINQRSMPIFGFNSYSADEIAVGSRTVTGQFSIRFTRPNYLFKLLEAAKQEQVMSMTSYKEIVHDRIVGEVDGKVDNTYVGSVAGQKHKELWPESFDIDVCYGHPSRGDSEVHIFLTGVRLISCQSGADSNRGVPVTEVYTFAAKDIKTLDQGLKTDSDTDDSNTDDNNDDNNTNDNNNNSTNINDNNKGNNSGDNNTDDNDKDNSENKNDDGDNENSSSDDKGKG